MYWKNPKDSDKWNTCCNLKFKQNSFDKGVMYPKDADGMAYSVDPDQVAPLGAVWSWCTLFV